MTKDEKKIMNLRLSKRLKRIRDARNLKQDEIATLMNYRAQAGYQALENNLLGASLARLLELGKLLEVSVGQLIGENQFYNNCEERFCKIHEDLGKEINRCFRGIESDEPEEDN